MIQAQRAHGTLDRCAHTLLRRGVLARGRNVNRLFEERAFQRIGLIEYREDAGRAAGDDAFHREFTSRNVRFHLQILALLPAGDPYVRAAFEQRPDARKGRSETRPDRWRG